MTRNVTASTVVVSEQDIARRLHASGPTAPAGEWTLFTRDVGVGSLVGGPGVVPAGSGSLQLSTPGGNDKAYLFNYQHIGTKLSDITALSYRTYRSAGDAQQVTALNVEIDHNGAAQGGYAILVFEPAYNPVQGTVTNNVWQAWDAVNGGEARWWSAHAISGVCAFSCYVSWADLKAANPDAIIIGGFGVNQGGGNPGLVSSVDALTIGISGTSTTYDFEPMLGPCSVDTDVSSRTLTLLADCVTRQTVSIPDGWTLDGDGYSITGMDPVGGHFLGAVVKNGGAVANVKDLTVTVAGLANACDGGDARLRGILFDGASGAIQDSRVIGINQGASGCQEGNAIEVRNAPFDATGTDVNVVISGNTVNGYQKTGIVANGSVAATITGNIVSGVGPVSYIAQNGIQIGYGATAMLRGNAVSGNNYTPVDTEACGLLYYEAAGVNASQNKMSRNEENLCNYGKGGGSFSGSPVF